MLLFKSIEKTLNIKNAMSLNYKSDHLFTKYLKMSAYSELLAVSSLNELGHDMIANDTGSCSSEIYKDLTLKKKRTADLVCKNCGLKVEVRAKSSLMVSMSDSEARPFHQELGLDTLICFLQVSEKNNNFYLDSDLFFTSTLNLLNSIGESSISNRKSSSKGSETFRIWPSIKAPFDCKIKSIDFSRRNLTVEKISSSESISISIPAKFFFIDNFIKKSSFIRKNSIIASSVKQAPSALLFCN